MNQTEIKFVIWEDAFGCPAGWHDFDEIELRTSVIHSVNHTQAADYFDFFLSGACVSKKVPPDWE